MENNVSKTKVYTGSNNRFKKYISSRIEMKLLKECAFIIIKISVLTSKLHTDMDSLNYYYNPLVLLTNIIMHVLSPKINLLSIKVFIIIFMRYKSRLYTMEVDKKQVKSVLLSFQC